MSSSRILTAALYLLALVLPLYGENRTDKKGARPPAEPVRGAGRIDNQPANPYGSGQYKAPTEIGGRNVDEWKKDLTDPDPSVRGRAIPALIQFGERSEGAVPLLLQHCISYGDVAVRVKAVMALEVMQVSATQRDKVIKALGVRVNPFTESQTIVRYQAAKVLRRFGADAESVTPDLIKGTMDHGAWEIRKECVETLRVIHVDVARKAKDKKQFKGPDPAVINALIPRVRYPDETASGVRYQAIIALGALGRPQDPGQLARVVEVLQSRQSMHSRHKEIQLWAHVALMALEDKVNEKYLKTIANFLTDHEREIRLQAVTAMGALAGKARTHVPDVLALLGKEREPLVVVAACVALTQMDDRGPRVLKALIELTRHPISSEQPQRSQDLTQVLAACHALATIGVVNEDVRAAITKVRASKELDTPSQKFLDEEVLKKLDAPKGAKRPAR